MTGRTTKPRLDDNFAGRWRDWSWWAEPSPYFGGRAIGALLAIGIVAPFIGATFLERALGDLPTVIILAALGVAALAGALTLLLRQRILFVPIMLFAHCIACGVCIYITLTMNW